MRRVKSTSRESGSAKGAGRYVALRRFSEMQRGYTSTIT
jgi:hypothetical protein